MPVRFIDLFAGIGGMRIPFDELGYRCVFTSEIDRYAQMTYKANFGEVPSGDITAVHEDDIPSHELLLAGFPCQPFSHAGKRLGFEEVRGTLFFDIVRIMKKHEPAIVFLENVRGFKWHDGGRTFEVACRVMEGLGYAVHWSILNARDFGLPQNRERVYIVALNRRKVSSQLFQWPVGDAFPTRLGDVLEPVVNGRYTISDKMWAWHQGRKQERRAMGSGFGYSLFDADSPYTRTLSARYHKDGCEILIRQQGSNPRRITPLEARRLQGFPDWFKVEVSDTQAYTQFGNAVPIPVIRAIAARVGDVLSSEVYHAC